MHLAHTATDPLPVVPLSPALLPDSPALAGPLRVEVVDDPSRLPSLAEPWNALAGDAPFRSWLWLECWWQHYHTGRDRLLLLLVRDAQGELVGLAPCYVHRGPLCGQSLRLLGSGEVCSDYLGILAQPGLQQPVAHCLADWLAGPGAGQWDVLEWEGAAAGDPAVDELLARLNLHGLGTSAADLPQCWRLELPDDWSRYLATLSRTRRERTRSLLRKYVDTGRVVYHWATSPERLNQGFDILVDLHQKRRQSLGDPGVFASPRFTAFHRQVTSRLLAAGRLRLFWAEFDGRPIAAEYALLGGRTIYYYQSGIDPESADLRPGWLAVAGSLRQAIADQFQWFDFLRGDEPYKASWGARPVGLTSVRAVGSPLSARARDRAWQAGRRLKQALRRAQDLTPFRRPGHTSPSGGGDS
jgi:CelD/BcsL family acetyltransferase involved in cellulose biosynthesis